MIYSKLCSNILKTSKDNILLNQRCLLYSNSILNKLNSDDKLCNLNNKLNSSSKFFINQRFLTSLYKQNVINKYLPIVYKDIPKSLLSTDSSSSDSRLEFKKINTSGDLNLVASRSPMENVLPKSFLPYMQLLRLNRLTGVMFLLYPCLWSIGLGGLHGELPNFAMMSKFIIGAILMRSAGCIINDLVDRDFDKKVERTKIRPLASGELTQIEAIAALTACLTGSLHILLSFDPLTISYGASSLLLVTLYPLMKRFTNWPQLFLGFTFNWGVILGWSAVQNGLIDWKIVLPLYLSGVCWTLIYDTIYAYQDYHYDKKLGLKSTTMIFGDNPKKWLNSFAAVMTTGFLYTGYVSEQLYPYYLGVGISAAHIAHIIRKLNIKDPNDCANQFKYSQFVGYYILMGILLSVLFDTKNKKPTKNIEIDIDLKNAVI